MKKTPYYSYSLGNLPKGCRLCVKGSKLVLFVTGLCPRSCYFCPISDKKYKKDVTYADEWPIIDIREIIKEAELIKAEGAGLTGGDPLCRLPRTLSYIKSLKRRLGKKFHIHLYTSLDLATKTSLKRLYKAGLDEIRFHLDLDDDKLWKKIALALGYDWDIGVEIPVIPKKEKNIIKIINFIDRINNNQKNKIRFLNLNELEIADNKINKLSKLGYKTKNPLSYAVKGSEESAFKLLRYIEKNKIRLDVHYCTATLKDKVQLANRIKRRAKNIKKPYDIMTEEGTLIRGAIYLADLKPGVGYRNRLSRINKKAKNKIIKKLSSIKNGIKKDFGIKHIDIDKNKLRILTSVEDVNKIKDKINDNLLKNTPKDKRLLRSKGLYLAVVEEYPTYDQFELSVEFL